MKVMLMPIVIGTPETFPKDLEIREHVETIQTAVLL